MTATAAQQQPSETPRLLDLFCGAGGCSVGYQRAGFEVVGVDIKPQKNYPFEFHQGDALAFLEEHAHEFDAIHASPPCQSYLNLTRLNESMGQGKEHPDLVGVTRAALQATGRVYAIENVVGAPLVNSVRLCGTSFNLPIRRHRLFESNIGLLGIPCAHDRFTEPRYWTSYRPGKSERRSSVVQVYGQAGETHEWPAAMGIDWMSTAELRLAIPPAYTECIGGQLMTAIVGEASHARAI